jgi:hypothetical protein
VRALRRQVAAVERWLTAIYRLDLDLRAERFVIGAERARALLPAESPRSGVLVVEGEGEAWLGLYVDPRDADDAGTIVEETSHLVCLAWHAVQGRRVSHLLLELQAEVDRWAVERLFRAGARAAAGGFRWAGWMDGATRELYETAHRVAARYCRGLARRFPDRRDTPALLAELRRFYRSDPADKLAPHP